jgi:UDP-2,3-diacylglucosamine pyrophosphatase LpxH
VAFTDREERRVQESLLMLGTMFEWLVQRTEGMTEQDNEHAANMAKELRTTVGSIRVHANPKHKEQPS